MELSNSKSDISLYGYVVDFACKSSTFLLNARLETIASKVIFSQINPTQHIT